MGWGRNRGGLEAIRGVGIAARADSTASLTFRSGGTSGGELLTMFLSLPAAETFGVSFLRAGWVDTGGVSGLGSVSFPASGAAGTRQFDFFEAPRRHPRRSGKLVDSLGIRDIRPDDRTEFPGASSLIGNLPEQIGSRLDRNRSGHHFRHNSESNQRRCAETNQGHFDRAFCQKRLG
jgi:hypothetical protein